MQKSDEFRASVFEVVEMGFNPLRSLFVVNVSGNYATTHTNDFLVVFNEIIRKCCQPLAIAWMEEELCLVSSKPDMDTAREILSNAPGLVVIDDRAANYFPTPLEVSNKDDVAVGRIRRDASQDGNYGLEIFVCGDQIRKGAALNAVQIAEKLL
ncbi:Aspartate-semialdehyde dehydrogenase [Forsythia ovata]|uniref:Aspartate-semialdehyde dehydrogenase n=1 Tax=Forsythia ovata TaxID=205694 RepID=A0ABD1WB53_9LAMI